MQHLCWMKWTDRTCRGASLPPLPHTQPHSLYCFFVGITLYRFSDNPSARWSPSPPAGYLTGIMVHHSSFPAVVLLSTLLLLCVTSSQLRLHSILYSQNNTVYVMQKGSTITKKNLKSLTAVSFRIWTYRDELSHALYYWDWFYFDP